MPDSVYTDKWLLQTVDYVAWQSKLSQVSLSMQDELSGMNLMLSKFIHSHGKWQPPQLELKTSANSPSFTVNSTYVGIEGQFDPLMEYKIG